MIFRGLTCRNNTMLIQPEVRCATSVQYGWLKRYYLSLSSAWFRSPGVTFSTSSSAGPRQDGQFNVTIAVHNQSNQALKRIAVALLDDNGGTARGADVTLETPLAPNGAYTFTTVIGGWTGTLRAIPWWCYPPSAG